MKGFRKVILSVIALASLAVLLWMVRGYISDTMRDEKRVVRLEKIAPGVPYKTEWQEHIVWVIKRMPEEIRWLTQNKVDQHHWFSGPSNSYRSHTPEAFVLFVPGEGAQANPATCSDFRYLKEVSETNPEGARYRCEFNAVTLHWDSAGRPLKHDEGALVVPPHYINNQKHLVIGHQ